MTVKRNRVNKPTEVECQICHKIIEGGNLVSHIKYKHRDFWPIEKYINEFGDFRKISEPKKGRNISKVECKILNCGGIYSINGFHNHLRDSHDELTPDEYVKLGHPEYRPEQLRKLKLLEKAGSDFQCLICQVDCSCETSLSKHIKIEHNISKKQYIFEYILHNKMPKCKCGCGQDVKIINYKPYVREMLKNHGLSGELNGMFGRIHSKETSERMRVKAIARTDVPVKNRNTGPELEFKDFLHKNDIKYEFQIPTKFGRIDFYLIDYDLFVEIDGKYWHPTEFINLNLKLLNSVIAQHRRKDMKNLVRIRCHDVHKIKTVDDLHRFNFKYNFKLDYEQIIIHKSYFPTLSDENKKKMVYLLMRLLRELQPTFPEIETHEDISKVIGKIKNYNFDKLFVEKTFNNNSTCLGISYLKSKFNSYWKSSYRNSKPPIQVWEDERIMRKIIEYRIGQNKTGEVFNFCLRQMIRGISASRYTISFFKPVLAAAIYKQFIGDKENPIVFDPCCGFGGRMLGFKSLYPNGTYFGCEPNIETYNELIELSKNFSNIQLFNCKIEDFNLTLLPENIDLSFTSIPYYDLETYSNPVEYLNFESWKESFIRKLKSLPNLLVNIPIDLRGCFNEECEEYFISSNTSHFNKVSNKKYEYLLKF